MKVLERIVEFGCEQEQLIGVLSLPEVDTVSTVGVVVMVGGPQYRAGSHRQFVSLARAMAKGGYPALRFDYRGMGDSSGELRDFQQVTHDVGDAIDAMQAAIPTLQRIALWGLCDGASAALLYCQARSDSRIIGVCLLNPWIRSDASLARAHVKHYYADRLRQKEFWIKLLSGKVALSAVKGLWRNLHTMFAGGKANPETASIAFQERMAQAWQTPTLPILLLLSENDYTAKEFLEYVAVNPRWRGLLDRRLLTREDLEGADHTLSTSAAKRTAERLTLEWLQKLAQGTLPMAADDQRH